jgi:Circularly permutated YpsA SLOG family
MLVFTHKQLNRVISGGQTGADQAGLFAADACGLETGGVAANGFKTSIGPAPWLAEFGLTSSGDYASRTKTNVKLADKTVILVVDAKSPGTKCAVSVANQFNKPYLIVDISPLIDTQNDKLKDNIAAFTEIVNCILRFINAEGGTSVLNIAGNRERTNDVIFSCVYHILVEVFNNLGEAS